MIGFNDFNTLMMISVIINRSQANYFGAVGTRSIPITELKDWIGPIMVLREIISDL